jgi:hypothetical protein
VLRLLACARTRFFTAALSVCQKPSFWELIYFDECDLICSIWLILRGNGAEQPRQAERDIPDDQGSLTPAQDVHLLSLPAHRHQARAAIHAPGALHPNSKRGIPQMGTGGHPMIDIRDIPFVEIDNGPFTDEMAQHIIDVHNTQHAVIRYAEGMAQVLAEAALASNKAVGNHPLVALNRWIEVIKDRAAEIITERQTSCSPSQSYSDPAQDSMSSITKQNQSG